MVTEVVFIVWSRCWAYLARDIGELAFIHEHYGWARAGDILYWAEVVMPQSRFNLRLGLVVIRITVEVFLHFDTLEFRISLYIIQLFINTSFKGKSSSFLLQSN